MKEKMPGGASVRQGDSGPMKIVFLMQQLSYGGAERQVVELAKGLKESGVSVVVAVFYPKNELESELQAAGVPIFNLEKRGRWDVAGFLWRLIKFVRRENPRILHSYLTVPNILAGLIKSFIPSTRIVWGIRSSNMKLSHYDWLSRLSYRLESLMSGRADAIIVNSEAGRTCLEIGGYPKEKITFIPNGIDTERFQPDRAEGSATRAAWGLDPGARVVGLVGRLDPMKGHETFLRAAAQAARRRDDLFFVCVGEGPGEFRESLVELSRELSLDGRVIWSGSRNDVSEVYNAFDVVCSASVFGEGFSNVTGEAMACGIPCVVTDVGDSARIVGDTGVVVPPGDPEALTEGLCALISAIEEKGQESSAKARERIVGRFSRPRLIETTHRALSAL